MPVLEALDGAELMQALRSGRVPGLQLLYVRRGEYVPLPPNCATAAVLKAPYVSGYSPSAIPSRHHAVAHRRR
jgi:hypothetical protein